MKLMVYFIILTVMSVFERVNCLPSIVTGTVVNPIPKVIKKRTRGGWPRKKTVIKAMEKLCVKIECMHGSEKINEKITELAVDLKHKLKACLPDFKVLVFEGRTRTETFKVTAYKSE